MDYRFLEKISVWLRWLGLGIWILILLISFQGKDDIFLERMALIVLIISILAFKVACSCFSGMRGTGVFFVFIAVICIITSIVAISKGYASASAIDWGVCSFRAERYWQEENTRMIRHRTIKSRTSYVRYEAVLENGETVSYKRRTASIGDAMQLVKKGDLKERQVFACNGGYYTKEPGTTTEQFLSDFLKWKTRLFLSAGIYGTLGILFLLPGGRETNAENAAADTGTALRRK